MVKIQQIVKAQHRMWELLLPLAEDWDILAKKKKKTAEENATRVKYVIGRRLWKFNKCLNSSLAFVQYVEIVVERLDGMRGLEEVAFRLHDRSQRHLRLYVDSRKLTEITSGKRLT